MSEKAVIQALYDLHERHGRWPTAGDVAAYLELDEHAARRALLSLRRARIFRDRQREGVRVWMPWRET